MATRSPPPDLEAMAQGVVAHLRRRLDAPSLTSGAPPVALAGGFVNPIFALSLAGAPAPYDRDLVVRVDGRGPGSSRFRSEFAVQRFAFEAGYPTPEPILVETDDLDGVGAPFLVMARAAGTALMDAFLPPSATSLPAIDLLPALMARLHDLPTDHFPRDDPRAIDRADTYRSEVRTSATADLRELAAVARWLDDHRPAPTSPVLCHLDLHPVNVLVDAELRHPVVIDWENSGLADPHLDLADMLVVLGQAPVDDAPRALAIALGLGRRALVRRVLGRYARLRPVDPARLSYFEVLAAARRLRGALLDRPSEPGAPAAGFTSPAYIDALWALIRRRTSLR